MKRFLFLLLVLTQVYFSQAQSHLVPIGSWQTHLPFTSTLAVADAGDLVYSATGTSMYSYNKTDNSFNRLSTPAGFSDVGIRGITYDPHSRTLVVAYTNSNLDFVFDREIYNYPFIQSSAISGDKNIYHVSFSGDTALLSCGFGMVLFEVSTRESPATCFFTDATGANLRANASVVYNNDIYAATTAGLYRVAMNEPNIQDFSKWDSLSGMDGLPVGEVHFVEQFNDALFAVTGDAIYRYTDGSWSSYFQEENWHTVHLTSDDTYLIVTQRFGVNLPADSCRILLIDADDAVTEIVDDTQLRYINQTERSSDGTLWIADSYNSLLSYRDGQFASYTPNGPATFKVQDMAVNNSILYVAPGEINASWNYQFNQEGFLVYDFGYWSTYNQFGYSILDTVYDFISVETDPRNSTVWFGSFGGGLVRYDRQNNSLELFKQGYLENVPGDPTSYRVGGLALDSTYNLWISNFGAVNPIAVRKADGNWMHINPGLPTDVVNQVGQIVVDGFNTKWIQLPRGNGILVYNENGTIDDLSDDLVKILGAGTGTGNLHTNFVNCIAVDKQNEIWVGTSEGITIFYNPGEVYTNTSAGDATQPLVNLGGYYEQLLRNDIVNTIAVDGANRKWVGTNSGAFLISDDGTEQLIYFNTDNSPLISNVVLNITIDGITGDVYFGTDKGIISYRYTATEGVAETSQVQVFPNPVREDYTGTIAINGLTPNAEVRITDMAGRTIWQAQALGGQAIWDGNGYDGGRAATGVYMVYATNEDGSQTAVAKILIMTVQ